LKCLKDDGANTAEVDVDGAGLHGGGVLVVVVYVLFLGGLMNIEDRN